MSKTFLGRPAFVSLAWAITAWLAPAAAQDTRPAAPPAAAERLAIPVAHPPGLVASAPMRLIVKPLPEERLQSQWRRAISLNLAARKGCFTATYPETTVHPVACVTPPNRPYRPRTPGAGPAAPGAQLVGNGQDFSNVVSGSMSWAEGRFQQITGILNENDNGTLDKYSLQLNTQFFRTNVCPAANAGCQGWEQYLMTSSGSIWIQYWLLNWVTATVRSCPPGWNTFGADCWINSANSTNVGAQKAVDLPALRLSGNVDTNAVDSVRLSKGLQFWIATGDSHFPDLRSLWTTAEFNVVGDGDGSQATFNANTTMTVSTESDSGTRVAPRCVQEGFTAETNNLDLVGTPSTVLQSEFPSIVFTQSNAPGGTAASCTAVNTLPAQWTLAGNTAGFGQVADGRPFWTGHFLGQPGLDVLFYYPGDKNWWLGRFDAAGNLTWNLAGNTAGFGQVADRRPFWVGNFRGTGSTDILFYYPGDKNWWLGRFDANGKLTWNLAGNTAGFGQVADGRPFWVGNFVSAGHTDILFYFPGDKNWWLGRFDANGTLTWRLAGNTAGFGQVHDGRPFWVAPFLGQGRDDILFYFPGDKNWWLGRFDANGNLTWNNAGNTAGFGQVGDGRPFWTGKFLGQPSADILFYFPGDRNWWLGRFDANGTLSWNNAGNTAGFGQVADGRPFWVGNFRGTPSDDLMFYYPGDQNWWRGQFDAAGTLTWALVGNTDNFGQVWDSRPFWSGDFDGQGASEVLFHYPVDHNWWLGRFKN